MNNIKSIAIFCLAFLSFVASAQNHSVRGFVRDTKGDPIPGAVVMLKGSSSVATLTDEKGAYVLSVPDDAMIEASCLGYKSQTAEIGRQTIHDFYLPEDSEVLEETVVIGYGAMRRSDLTGAVSSVRIDDDHAARSTTFDQLLDGKAAGVQVMADNSNPDAGVSIRIRGLSTFSGHSDPLYVVDGVIIDGETSSMSVFSSAVGENVARESESTNALAGINPQDIASIEILKDASATAIYGSQGANGVVLITTKQAKSEKPSVNFSAGCTIGQAGSRYDNLTFDQYASMVRQYDRNGEYKERIYKDPETCTELQVQPMDWQDYVFRTSVSQRYYFSIGGRPKGCNYHISLGYNKVEGVLECTDSEGLSGRVNISKDFFEGFTLGFKSLIGYTKSNLVNGANNAGTSKNYSSVMSSTLFTFPFKYISEDGNIEEEEDLRYSPARSMEGSTNVSERLRVTPSMFLNWKFHKLFTFRSTFGADVVYSHNSKTKNNIMSFGHGNIAGIGEALASQYNWDNLLMFNLKKGRHNVSATLGESYSMKMRKSTSVSADRLPNKATAVLDVNSAAPENSYYNGYGEEISSILSFFGRCIYSFADRYVFTGTIRADGSSKFLGSNKWGFFPSAAFAWRITSEPWFYIPWISNAKLRLGWGQVGNQNIGSYLTDYLYASSYASSHYDTGKLLAIYSSNIANADLKWETTTQENIGLDLSFFRGRLTLTADAYNKDTRDLLQSKNVAYSTGFKKMYINDGWISNYGLEITLEGVPLKRKGLEWTVGANLSINRNIIKNVGAMGDNSMIHLDDHSEAVQRNFFYGDSIFSSTVTAPVNIFIEGQPMGMFYGYVTDGIVQENNTVKAFSDDTYRDAGTLKYKDLNGNGYMDDGDRTVIGNPHPKFTYGFNTEFSWKNLSVKMDFAGAYKFDIANMNNVWGYYTTLSRNGYTDAWLHAWTPDNRDTVWPEVGAVMDAVFSDRYVEDGSWFKISNIAVSYVFKIKRGKKVTNRIGLTFSVGNPYVWTNYTGMNPTTNSYGTDVKRLGVDLNSTPWVRSYNIDLKFNF